MIVARAETLTVERVISRRECVIAIGEGELRGDALAAALHADLFVLRDDAALFIDSPRAWSGVVWRMGFKAMRLSGQTGISAQQALRHGLCDALVAIGSDPVEWLGGRSAMALDSAATLIARRGGDALERAEFARLFAAGEPQRGLGAFLEKRKRS